MKLSRPLTIRLALLISIPFMALAVFTQPANASSGPSITILNGPGINICSSISFSLPIAVNASAAFSNSSTMTVPGVGTVWSFSQNFPAASGTFSYGINPSAYTVAPGTPVTVSITTFIGQNESGGVSTISSVVINCSTGALLGGGSAGGPGPGIPAGFVLHTIGCTVAVYSTPGGTPVSGATIIDGQTWYVSPTPVKDGRGERWTEIFVGGPFDGFIPTSCVY